MARPAAAATGANGIPVILRPEAIRWERRRELREQEEREKATLAPQPILAPAGRGRHSIQPSWKIMNRRTIQPYPAGISTPSTFQEKLTPCDRDTKSGDTFQRLEEDTLWESLQAMDISEDMTSTTQQEQRTVNTRTRPEVPKVVKGSLLRLTRIPRSIPLSDLQRLCEDYGTVQRTIRQGNQVWIRFSSPDEAEQAYGFFDQKRFRGARVDATLIRTVTDPQPSGGESLHVEPESVCDANSERSGTNCSLWRTYGDGRMKGYPYRLTTILDRPCETENAVRGQEGDLKRDDPLLIDSVGVVLSHP